MLRARVPERLVVSYTAFGAPGVPGADRLLEAIERAGSDLVPENCRGPALTFTWRRTVLVLGLVRRNVEETIELYAVGGTEPRLELSCAPQALHDAHAAGAGGVIAFTAAAGLTAGLPAAIATLLAGSLLAFVAREHSLLAFRRRLEMLALDLGEALWPGVPGQVRVHVLQHPELPGAP